MPENLRQRIESDLPFLVDFRRDLHRHPELLYQEVRTSKRVAEELSKSGIEHAHGLAGGTGVLGWIPPTQAGGATVALRADMDALPILEETGLDYASQNPGVMHACGHDGHTSILLGAARALSQEQNRRNGILLLFQPAEEGGAGAKRMIEDGALSGKRLGAKADAIYGLHGYPSGPQGQFTTRIGPFMAAADQFSVVVKGKGGHAAMPHLAVDPVVVAAQIVTNLQTIASRTVAPIESVVVTVTTLEAGKTTNVIPEQVTMTGTVRSLKPEIRAVAKERLFGICEGLAAAHGCKAEVEWRDGYPVTCNDAWATERFFALARERYGEQRVGEHPQPVMGAEDFSFYGAEAPAAFYFVGLRRAGDKDPAQLHTPRFDFNEAVIPDCVEMMCRLALEPLERGTRAT